MCTSSSTTGSSSRRTRFTCPSSESQADHVASSNSYLTVTHDYHDYADEPCPLHEQSPINRGSIHASANVPFPVKLYYMLEDIHASGDTSIVSWQPHGRAFVVHKPEELVALLPKYFKLSKVSSYNRQLNLYSFLRLTKGPDRSAYYHPCFLRGKPFLLSRIQRCKIKGTRVRSRSDPEHEPDFYKMKPVGVQQETCAALSKVTVGSEDVVSQNMPPAQCQSSNSVVSSEIDYLIHKRPQHVNNKTKSFDSLFLTSAANTQCVSAWGMPFMYLGPGAFRPNVVAEKAKMEEKVDEAYMDQTLRDILKETDDLLTEPISDNIVAV
ncbi:hypothetical protein MPSEU_000114300 [Mayamaea pseudoterrestris]|nr:hypothetical protein MPSEU_000114300 [Mayamaea pseudoterrestris]